MKNKILILLAVILIMQICLASALTIGSVKSNPIEVQPGEKIHLSLTIKNDLTQDVENVIVSLNLNGLTDTTGKIIIPVIPFAPYQSSNEDIIDSINEDEHETAGFDLIALSSADSGTYTIPVQIIYTGSDDNKSSTENFLISATINAKPKIDISSETSLIKGTSGKITIKIVNSGLGSGKFISVNLKQVSGIKITSPNSVYIGNIDSNDFDTTDFNVFTDANAPSPISIPVEITYADSRNNQTTETRTISINTYTGKEAAGLGLVKGNNTFLIIIFVVIVIIIYLVYRSIRKRRRSKINGQ